MIGIYIGRFQPFHLGHLQVVEKAATEVDTLIIFIGSAQHSNQQRNPFSFEDRKKMILESISHISLNIEIEPLLDCEDDIDWLNQIKQAIANRKDPIRIYGANKDATTWYLCWIENELKVEFINLENSLNICATDIRTYFHDLDYVKARVPLPVYNFLYERQTK